MRTPWTVRIGIALMTISATSAFLPAATASVRPVVIGSDSTGEHVVTVGGTRPQTAVPLVVDRLAPGSTVSEHFRLHLTGGLLSGRPAVVLTHVRDQERGCIHPELVAGDATCGDGDDQGELSTQLLAGVTWEPPGSRGCAGAASASPTGTMSALSGTTLSTDAFTATGADSCVALTLTLPMSADNLVQSDAVSFDLSIGVLDAVRETDLAGSSSSGGYNSPAAMPLAPEAEHGTRLPAGHGVGGLPFTGLPLMTLGLLGLGLIHLAVAALRAGSRRGHSLA
jgi:hypothetical protein